MNMSPELLAAVAERVERGYSDEQIRTELAAAGHDDATITKVLATARTEKVGNPRTIPVADLPSVTKLVSEGWRYAKEHSVLSLVLAIPVVLLYMLETTQQMMSGLALPLSVLMFLVVIANILCTVAVLYVVVQTQEGEPPQVSTGFSWAIKNIWSLLWLGILAVLVVWGGLMLFVIPGLVVSFYIYFAQYVFVREGLKGFPALLRSRQLVSGDALAVAGRLLGVGFLFLGLFILFFITIGLIVGIGSLVSSTDVSELPAVDWTVGLLGQLAGAVLTVISLRVTVILYQALALKKPYVATAELPGHGKYLALAIWGLVSLALFVALAVAFAPERQSLEKGFDVEESSERIIDLDAKDRAMELRLNQ